jgi:hypothetical protein
LSCGEADRPDRRERLDRTDRRDGRRADDGGRVRVPVAAASSDDSLTIARDGEPDTSDHA